MTEPTSSNYVNQEESNLFQSQPVVVYGSFWERFGALIIDGIALYLVQYVLQMIFGTPSPEEVAALAQNEGFGAVMSVSYFNTASLLSNLITLLYFSFMHSSSWQATLGKRALGLKVTNMEGGRISFLNALGRYFATILSALIIFIGYLMMLWDDKKQTLHDKLAGTLVVKGK
ncbi:RDD family protein [Niabella insulamsoli]|uniref:RDD family protein n=1 Tax=Niabella insulamsoli TaxID=3144874 RepID=UPI0031FDB625